MFADRLDAGKRLAAALKDVPSDALILGIPRGGVIVARAVADALDADLDVIVTRKIGAPGNPELAIGAIGPDGAVALDPVVLRTVPDVTEAYLAAESGRQSSEIRRRLERYRGDRPPMEPAGRTCVLVDDGIATGSTARAAIVWLKEHGAARVVLAVPVAPADTLIVLEPIADETVCLSVPRTFYAVGQWYDRFDEVSDRDVVDALARPADARN